MQRARCAWSNLWHQHETTIIWTFSAGAAIGSPLNGYEKVRFQSIYKSLTYTITKFAICRIHKRSMEFTICTSGWEWSKISSNQKFPSDLSHLLLWYTDFRENLWESQINLWDSQKFSILIQVPKDIRNHVPSARSTPNSHGETSLTRYGSNPLSEKGTIFRGYHAPNRLSLEGKELELSKNFYTKWK